MQKHRAIGAAALAAAVIATPLALQSSASFTASITNDTNTAGSAGFSMKETDTDRSIDCSTGANNTFVCSTINKYGGDMAMKPGDFKTVNLTFTNTGSTPATGFTLTPGSCTSSDNGTPNGTADLCDKMLISIDSGATNVISKVSARSLSTVDLAAVIAAAHPVAPGASVPITITTTFDAGADNTYMGRKISQSLTWTFTA